LILLVRFVLLLPPNITLLTDAIASSTLLPAYTPTLQRCQAPTQPPADASINCAMQGVDPRPTIQGMFVAMTRW